MNLLPDITSKPKDPENRYFPRWEIDKRAEYRLQQSNAEKEARAIDLSCSGACIVTPEPLLPTQKVKLNIYLNNATVVTISGKVVWVKHWSNKNEAGVDFDSVDQRTQDLILEHAFSLNKQDLIKYWFKGWNGKSV